MAALVPVSAEAGIEVSLFPLCQHAGVKLGFVPFLFTEADAVRIMHIAIEFIRAGRPVCHRHGNDAPCAQDIIEVVPPVWPDRHVRGVQVALQVSVVRILVLPVNNPFIPPVAEVVRRRRPADIIPHAVHIAAEKIVGTVYIYPVSEKVGFSVRNIFPVRKIRIDHLFSVHAFPLLCFLPPIINRIHPRVKPFRFFQKRKKKSVDTVFHMCYKIIVPDIIYEIILLT